MTESCENCNAVALFALAASEDELFVVQSNEADFNQLDASDLKGLLVCVDEIASIIFERYAEVEGISVEEVCARLEAEFEAADDAD